MTVKLERWCKVCKVYKHISEFYASSAHRKCKSCIVKEKSDYYYSNGKQRKRKTNDRLGMRRYCSKCKKTYPRDKRFFGRIGRIGKKFIDAWCKKCRRALSKKYRAKIRARLDSSRPRFRYRANWYLRSRYGIDESIYNKMLLSQGGKCKICKCVNPSGKRLFVDHHADTGIIRGLLCGCCNFAIGYFKDDPNLLVQAIKYLQSHANIKPNLEWAK